MIEIAEILLRGRHWLYHPTWSISCLLMTWWCKESGHQQQWYWPAEYSDHHTTRVNLTVPEKTPTQAEVYLHYILSRRSSFFAEQHSVHLPILPVWQSWDHNVQTLHHLEMRQQGTRAPSQYKDQGPVSISRPSFPGMRIPMLKIRRSRDRLIFNIPYTGKTTSLYWDGPLGPVSILDKTSYCKISWSLEAATLVV